MKPWNFQELVAITSVRLQVEQNQLVAIFGEIVHSSDEVTQAAANSR
jgi:hypothetical protein